jgi:hypothetical protein
MQSIDLHPDAFSISKIRRDKKFSGLKLDAKRIPRIGFGDYAVAINATTDSFIWSQGHVNSSPLAAREIPRAMYGCSTSVQTK